MNLRVRARLLYGAAVSEDNCWRFVLKVVCLQYTPLAEEIGSNIFCRTWSACLLYGAAGQESSVRMFIQNFQRPLVMELKDFLARAQHAYNTPPQAAGEHNGRFAQFQVSFFEKWWIFNIFQRVRSTPAIRCRFKRGSGSIFVGYESVFFSKISYYNV